MKSHASFVRTCMSRIPLIPNSLVIAAGFFALLAIQPATAQSPTRIVRLLLPASNSSLPLLLLADQDPIPEVDIRAEIYRNHAQALAMLLRGEAELLLTGTSQGWENFLSGSPLLMISTGVWGISYLIGSRYCPPIRSIPDLAGKTIALPFPGSPLDFQTRFLLQRYGLDPDRDLEIIYCPPPQTAALLLMGQIDAAPIPEPLASQLVANQRLPRLLDYQQAWASACNGDPRSPQVSLFALRNYGETNVELLDELIHLWAEAARQVVDEPAEAARNYAGILGFSEEVVNLSIPGTLFFVPSPAENRDRVRAYYEAVKRFLPGKRGELEDEFFFACDGLEEN